MTSTIQTPKQALNPAFLKQKPSREEIDLFKKEFISLLDRINKKESEEFHKNLLKDFLNAVYYKDKHYINTKDRNDLVVHNDNHTNSPVGVLIETKSPKNQSEMITVNDLNKKSFQELVLYYLRERKTGKNFELRYLIITNIYEWFVFDAQDFEKLFYQDKTLLNCFEQFQAGKLAGTSTDFFYKEIAAPAIERLTVQRHFQAVRHSKIPRHSDESQNPLQEKGIAGQARNDGVGDEIAGHTSALLSNQARNDGNVIPFVHFNINDYDTICRSAEKEDERKLIALYKFLSPVHLLKLPFANDNNQLNREFYAELLHIIGLEEITQDGKKLIVRKEENERNSGSLIENAMERIVAKNKIVGANNHSPLQFDAAFDLAITWINRILFLKLLESQILKYHNGDKNYAFLSYSKDAIRSVLTYGDLDTLFFSVLARKEEERTETIRQKYTHVPYLNSSLFEMTEMENKTICIDSLQDNIEMPLYSKSVLASLSPSEGGELLPPLRGGLGRGLRPLEYLLRFLDAYDFSSEGAEDIQEENKPLISAAVLGLIFEKINGYKDGSFFTPSFITMYMCRETISRAVVEKFVGAGFQPAQSDCVGAGFQPAQSDCVGAGFQPARTGWKPVPTIADLHNIIPQIGIKRANEIFNSIRICDPAVGSGHFLVSALNELIYLKSELGILCDKNGKTLWNYSVAIENDELIVRNPDGDIFTYNPKNPESQRVQETFFSEKQILIENCLFGVDINPNSVKICQLRLWIELLKHAHYIVETTSLPSPQTFSKTAGMPSLQTLPNIDINIKCGNSLMSRFSLTDKYYNISGFEQKIRYATAKYKEQVALYKETDNKEAKRQIVKNIENEKNFFLQLNLANDQDYLNLEKAKAELALHIHGTFEVFRTDEWQNKAAELTENVRKFETIYNEKVRGCFEWRFEFPEVLDENGNFTGFDVVIGNPPYINVKNDKNYSHYKTFQCFELYAYFFERGFALLKRKGLFAFITGNLYLKGVKYESLRKFLSSSFDLLELNNVGDNVFENVKMPTTVFIGKKEINSSWSFDDMNKDFSILKNIEKNTVSISSISKIMRGLEFGRDKVGINGDIPFITGSNVCKYGLTKISYIDKNVLNDYSKDKYFFEGERLLLRETGSNITALYLDDILYSNRSLFSIKIIDENFDPKFVLGCLNSKLLQFYYQTKFKAETEIFPKIRMIQAKELPIPNISLEQQQPIISLVEAILAKKNAGTDTTALEREIDGLVYALYGLGEEEIGVIETV